MHGPEQVFVHLPHTTAGEAVLDTLRVSRPRTGTTPALRSLKSREGRAGHRLEVDDPLFNRNFSRSSLRHFEDSRKGTHEPGRRFPQKHGS